jgi:hypothetical protein
MTNKDLITQYVDTGFEHRIVDGEKFGTIRSSGNL